MTGSTVAPISLLRLGTRGSALAWTQTDYVAALLQAAWPAIKIEIEVLQTQGDRVLHKPLPLIGGKGLFTAELEEALRAGSIDLAVHSLKDLPTEQPAGLILGAVPERADARDVVISRGGHTLATLPDGAAIGTSSRRRAAQVRHCYPRLRTIEIRGNVDTRIRRALDPDGPYDAIILAHAGLERLGRSDGVTELLAFEQMLPAPGQAALAVQCRDDDTLRALLAPLNHAPTRAAVEAERAFLHGLGGGCSVPVAAYAEALDGHLVLRGRVNSIDGATQIDVMEGAAVSEAVRLGHRLAQEALLKGAAPLLQGTP